MVLNFCRYCWAAHFLTADNSNIRWYHVVISLPILLQPVIAGHTAVAVTNSCKGSWKKSRQYLRRSGLSFVVSEVSAFIVQAILY